MLLCAVVSVRVCYTLVVERGNFLCVLQLALSM